MLPTYPRRPQAVWLALLLLLAAGGCVLLAPYDPTTDRSLNDLVVRTETFLAHAEATRAPYARSAAFYQEAVGTVRAIRLRAGLYDRNTEETELLDRLEKRYGALATIHREGPITASAAGGLRVTLRALLRTELAKKRSAGLRQTAPNP